MSVVYMDDEGQPTKTGGVIPQSTIMRELHIKVQSGFTLPDQSCCQQCVRGGMLPCSPARYHRLHVFCLPKIASRDALSC